MLKQFSRQVARALPSPWFHFEDDNGWGHCQPDLLIIFSSYIIIVEVKLTQTTNAWNQLALLYKPVVELAFGLPCYTLQVCKHLRWEGTARVSSLEDFLLSPRRGLWTLHYLP